MIEPRQLSYQCTRVPQVMYRPISLTCVACKLMERVIAKYICKGARITYLYPCCTANQHVTAINSIICDEATFQAATTTSCRQISVHCCDVNNRCHATCWKQNKASLHVKKKKYFFIHIKSPKQVITHASITDCSFVFFILSNMPRPSTSKHFPGTLKYLDDFV